MRILTVLYLGIIIHLSVVLSAGVRGPLRTPLRAENGGYDVAACTPDETELISEGIKLSQVAAGKALQDVPKGRFSKYGFWTLFKTQANVVKVQQILENLVTMPPMPHLWRDAAEQTSSPVFVCLSEDTEEELLQDSLQRCKANQRESAYRLGNSAFIMLCPPYFRYPLAPRRPEKQRKYCPTLQRNQYIGEHRKFIKYQFQVLLHQLVHFYLGPEDVHDAAEAEGVREIYELNEIVAQRATHARLMPNAYAYYIASSESAYVAVPEEVPRYPRSWLSCESTSVIEFNAALPEIGVLKEVADIETARIYLWTVAKTLAAGAGSSPLRSRAVVGTSVANVGSVLESTPGTVVKTYVRSHSLESVRKTAVRTVGTKAEHRLPSSSG